ncbi:DASS family sodium-coupled anion symporter [Bremerella cremea]|uniref:SLC13 family permease n=1 Tax=Bremerella cremea TaxID=1031537 RepID=UPI0031EE35E8
MTEAESSQPTLAARVGLWLGPGLAIVLWVCGYYGYHLDPEQPQLNAMAGAFVWMGVWWLTEAIPLAATSLLPLALFPLLGLQSVKQVAAAYGDHNIFLFLGGFLIALAIEQSGLHRRLALSIVYVMGDNPGRILLGFMVATGLMSMWISNTATALLMLPIAGSILNVADSRLGNETARRNMGIGLMLGIAYSASIGGVATLVGTPPNIAFASYYRENFPDSPEVSFLAWMVMALPFSVVFMLITWGVLGYLLFPVRGTDSLGGRDLMAEELRKLGKMNSAEWRAGLIFLATALLWILREPIDGWGWGMFFVDEKGNTLVSDATTAMAMAVLCFIVPKGKSGLGPLLTWEASVKVPWGVLLLFGGGTALARAVNSSHFDLFLGSHMASVMSNMSESMMVVVTATGMVWLTEFTSNLASVQTFNPVLGSASKELGVPPLLLLVPATLAASCAFMMPVATPPNAIVYGSGRVPIGSMIRAGVVLNILSIILVSITVLVLGRILI